MQPALQRPRGVALLCGVLALLTALTGLAVLGQSRPVAAQAPYNVYLPWVPNGDTLNGQGPWHGKVSFQNLSENQCSVSIFVGRPGFWQKTAQLSVNAYAVRSISASSLAVPEPGAPVRLEAFCPLAATAKILLPDVLRTPWSDDAIIVTGYTALTQADVDAAQASASSGWFLPIVQTNSGWNSNIRIANLAEQTTGITLRLYSHDNQSGSAGAALTIQRTIQIGATINLNIQEELGIPEWVGYAEIHSDGPVTALVHRSKLAAATALTNVAMSGDIQALGSYRMAAPLLFTGYNDWNTGINLANISDQTANVTISYFAAAGGFVREEQLAIAPRSMQYIYTPAHVAEQAFVGSGLIQSDVPLVAAIDEVKYSTIEALSYLASSVSQQWAAIPIAFREDPARGRHDNSGINIHNMNPDAEQTVEITFLSNTGEPVLPAPIQLTLPAGSNNFVYLPQIPDFPPGTVAAARITSNDAAGFVAVSNDVNYVVPGDGSVVFSATGVNGYLQLVATP
jgi:hypothetical protein